MKKSVLFNTHVKRYEDWFKKYPEVYLSEVAAIKEQLIKLPENIKGIEVGLGTGRFAQTLGIKEGIEPSPEMAAKAINRGIEVVNGYAENLPYKDLHFDFVLFVTICHLDDIKIALKEAHRVLKHFGSIIIGFIDKDQKIGKAYEEKRKHNSFLKYANFYSVNQVEKLLIETGFKKLEFNQTLFGALDEIKEVQLPKSGFGKGSFVVVKAIKK
ncbi:class I SAM-dependent methyltransferase [Lutibacter flavus]|uniref:Ubiquinone/menaquinone biosynthesis C-methylase UbiE n=1 Tax=Lutibacter flavus TaxID=691689 RepID=A0A238XLS8_9FLAO|nr:class I SAM-dependent methyltransferase [Lutibacter flavus]SNR59632.1 Ubiquinone/menaquinone biosynthesis C-methylase UbiE [Lutibacter flavus]